MTVSQDEIDRKAKLANDEKELALNKAKAEFEEWKSATSVAARAATAVDDGTKSDLAVAKAQVEFAKSLVPDFSKVDRGSLKLDEGKVVLSSPLALGALHQCAHKVAMSVGGVLSTSTADHTVLVVPGFDLATSDAAHLDLTSGLSILQSLADALKAEADRLASDVPSGKKTLVQVAAVAAAVSAVPSVLSLLAAHRTLVTQDVPSDDDTAAAAVAGALSTVASNVHVQLDALRVLPGGSDVINRRDALVDRRRELDEALVRLGTAPAAKDLAKRIGVANKGIDSFLDASLAIAKGGTRSPLAQAVLREGLHNGKITYVLGVHASPGGALETLDDRPIGMRDTFSAVVSIGITYTVVDVRDNNVVAGGVEVAAKGIHGTAGKELSFEFQDAAEPDTD